MGSMPRGRLVACAIVAWTTVAHADDAPLDRARAAVDASDYDTARGALAEALASGASGPVELAEIYRLTGIVSGAIGDAAAATDAFERWLALTPKAQLPAGTSPKIARPFKAAQAFFKTHDAIRAKVETGGHPATATLVVASDPLHMIARARVTFRATGKAERSAEGTRDGTDRIAVALPLARRLDLVVAALDEHGNRVVELGSTDVPIVLVDESAPVEVEVKPPPPPRPRVVVRPRPPRRWYADWRVWGIAGVAFAGATTYFAIETKLDVDTLHRLDADSVNHTFAEAQHVEARARRDLVLAQVGLGTTAVLAAGAAVLFLTRPHASAERAAVTAVPMRGGGAVVLEGRF